MNSNPEGVADAATVKSGAGGKAAVLVHIAATAGNVGAELIVDPTPNAVASIATTYRMYPNAQGILPAMGYGEAQIKDLEASIEATPCDVVISATPIDITRVLKVNKPMVRATYDLAEARAGQLEEAIRKALVD